MDPFLPEVLTASASRYVARPFCFVPIHLDTESPKIAIFSVRGAQRLIQAIVPPAELADWLLIAYSEAHTAWEAEQSRLAAYRQSQIPDIPIELDLSSLNLDIKL